MDPSSVTAAKGATSVFFKALMKAYEQITKASDKEVLQSLVYVYEAKGVFHDPYAAEQMDLVERSLSEFKLVLAEAQGRVRVQQKKRSDSCRRIEAMLDEVQSCLSSLRESRGKLSKNPAIQYAPPTPGQIECIERCRQMVAIEMVDLIKEENLDYTMKKLSSQQALSSLSVNG
ncbi:hypothetical protein [Corynebacterium marquesiae]|uniref:hypothetical protein n=1 Tax=Corynebacterium marquesiae TaxID=2913503 RepID=UPI0038D121DA